jgi:hypothetical protein
LKKRALTNPVLKGTTKPEYTEQTSSRFENLKSSTSHFQQPQLQFQHSEQRMTSEYPGYSAELTTSSPIETLSNSAELYSESLREVREFQTEPKYELVSQDSPSRPPSPAILKRSMEQRIRDLESLVRTHQTQNIRYFETIVRLLQSKSGENAAANAICVTRAENVQGLAELEKSCQQNSIFEMVKNWIFGATRQKPVSGVGLAALRALADDAAWRNTTMSAAFNHYPTLMDAILEILTRYENLPSARRRISNALSHINYELSGKRQKSDKTDSFESQKF